MMNRKLGKSDLTVSSLGFGAWAIGGPWTINNKQAGWGKTDDDESVRAIHCALDHGINFFDTAANYGCGHSEKIIGKALEGKRDKAIIATKFGYKVDTDKMNVSFYGGEQNSSEVLRHIKADCEASLRRLGMDYIDLFQFHIGAYAMEKAAEVRDALEELVSEGKIRYYGWSTDNVESARIFSRGKHCTAIQHQLNIFYDAPAMLDLCESENLAAINRGPLARGLLSGKYGMDAAFAPDDMRSDAGFRKTWMEKVLPGLDKIRSILTADGRTTAQGALAWIWARSAKTIPIPGIRTRAQARENAEAMKFGPLIHEQMEKLREFV